MSGDATRRAVLAGGIVLMGAGGAHAGADPFAEAALAESLARYIGFGEKHSGGAGDNAAGAWMEETLSGAGFRTTRQTFEAPFFEPRRSVLVTVAGETPVWPLRPVKITAPVAGPLVLRTDAPSPRGAIVAAKLPYARWSTAESPIVRTIVDAAARDGAAALLLVTEGPTGEAVALNVDAHRGWPLPVAVLAPKAFATLASAMGQSVTLDIQGAAGMRVAFNNVGTRVRGRGKRIVVSTPRSAWTAAAGERGGGIAVWRALARWLPGALPDHDITMLATSGHEYENLGGEAFLKSALAPRPAETGLWVHLGANVASRDWHELGPRLLPLPSVDPQRFLVASEVLVPELTAAFRGAPGLERVYPASAGAAGELGNILAAGYPRAFGMFGAHRFHHTTSDDARCIEASFVAPVAAMVRDAITRLA